MKLTVALFCSMSLIWSTHAQNQLSGNITTTDQKPIEFATVSIYPVIDSTKIIGVSTGQTGTFEFLNLQTDQYRLTVQMLGYVDWTKIIDVNDNIYLEPIPLIEESNLLAEVQVLAHQSVIESHLGKKVLRIGQDLSTTGSNALEALDNIPSVTTTPRGQIQIRGNSNVIIYINGKATRRDPATLKFIAAESLEKIEIITNPSAKYDAEGVGGVINLVYKKDKTNAFKLETISNLSVSTNPLNLSPNVGVNASWTKDNISIFSNLSHEYSQYEDFSNSRRNNFQDSLQLSENHATDKGVGNISNVLIGCSIEPDSTLSMGLELNFDRWNLKNDIRQRNIFDYKFTGDLIINSLIKRTELEDELWLNIFLEKEFKKEKTLKISLTMGGEDETNFSESGAIEFTEREAIAQRFLSSSDELESQRYYNGKIDYEMPFYKWGTIETGTKVEFINYDIFQRIALQSDAIQSPDNDFSMNMQKLGLYVIQKNQIKKLEYAIGLRFEQFSSKAFQQANQKTFDQNYVRLFPSLQLNYLLSDREHTIGFNYTRRINRPGFFELNPYVSFEDPLNLETGNPALRPEIADLLEINYHQEWKKISVDFTIYRRRTRDAIQSIVREIDNSRSLATSVNIGKEKNRGIEMQIEYRGKKLLKASGTLVISQNLYTDQENEIRFDKQTTWSVLLRQQWKLNKNWKIEVSETYRAPSFQIQEKRHENYYMNIAVNKKLNNNRGSITLSIRDLFNTRQYVYSLQTSRFKVERSYKWQTRLVTLGLKYKLIDKKS